MHAFVLAVVCLHVLPGVFWAGSTFALARGATPSGPLVRSQLGAAAVSIASGAGLWFLFHRGGEPGRVEHVLAAGALAAIAAAAVQALIAMSPARALAGAAAADLPRLQARIARGQLAAAPLLMITVACMAVARYA